MKKEDLKLLKQEMPIKWRVQAFSKNKPVASCIAYIDSRDAQDLLDKVCGEGGWYDEYKEIKGRLFCGVSIKVEDEWLTKWDCGIESKTESEKGEASDAFKRAAVKWGVGRFLYKKDIQYVKSNEIKTKDTYPYVVDDYGKRVWDITTHVNNLKK